MEQIVETIRQAVEHLIETVKNLEERLQLHIEENAKRFEIVEKKIAELEETVFDDIIGSAEKLLEQRVYEDGLGAFSEKYKDTFAPYNDYLKKVEGEEFDFPRTAYNSLLDFRKEHEGQEIDEDEFVNALIESIKEQMERVRAVLGAESVEVENKNGETKVEIDGGEKEAEDDITEDELLELAEKEKNKVLGL